MMPPLKIVILQLGQFTGFEDINDSEKAFLEFFTNRPFTTEVNDVIREADAMVDRSTWSEQERALYDYEKRMKENYELGMDYAEQKGIEKGIEKGHILTIVKLFKDGTITKEKACLELEMSEEDFDHLLRDNELGLGLS
jgi:hypothetical protein